MSWNPDHTLTWGRKSSSLWCMMQPWTGSTLTHKGLQGRRNLVFVKQSWHRTLLTVVTGTRYIHRIQQEVGIQSHAKIWKYGTWEGIQKSLRGAHREMRLCRGICEVWSPELDCSHLQAIEERFCCNTACQHADWVDGWSFTEKGVGEPGGYGTRH